MLLTHRTRTYTHMPTCDECAGYGDERPRLRGIHGVTGPRPSSLGGGAGVKLTGATDYISDRRDKPPPFLGGLQSRSGGRVRACVRACERLRDGADGWMDEWTDVGHP